VKETIKGLLLARKFVTKLVSGGKDVLFVGTKRQARACIDKHVRETNMPYVTERWLGGTLTNFRTIRERLKRLEELEALEASGEIDNYSKKMESQLRREKSKILRNLEGIRNMDKLPGAMVVVDVKREMNALREARKLGIPTVCLIDTDSDPDFSDIVIPGNDDAMRAIDVIIDALCKAVQEGKSARSQQGEGKDESKAKAAAEPQRKRSRRAMFRAEDAEESESSDEASSEKPSTESSEAEAKAEGEAEAKAEAEAETKPEPAKSEA